MKKSAFTLVELIIVITILAILRTIGFMSFQTYTTDARDGKRKTDLSEVRKGLELYQLKNATLPLPDQKQIIVYSGTQVLAYQGYLGLSVQKLIKATNNIKDSKDDEYYTYTTDGNQKKYQLMSYLENNLTSYINPVKEVFAQTDYTTRKAYSIGNYAVFFSGTTNAPLQESLTTNTGTLQLTGATIQQYNVIISGTGIITATGTSLANIVTTSTNTSTSNNVNNGGNPIIYNCIGSLVMANANISNTGGLTSDATYQNTNSSNSCYYTCKSLYTGADCGTEILKVQDVFATSLYTGNGSSRTINNGIDLSGKGGMVWIKDRTRADKPQVLYNTIAGGTYGLTPSGGNSGLQTGTESQRSYGSSGIGFLNNGFSLGTDTSWSVNNYYSSDNYVAWTFRKAPKFFDVVTFTYTGTTQIINHNLQSNIGAIIMKRTDSNQDWLGRFRRTGVNSGYRLSLSTNEGNAGADLEINHTNSYFTPGSVKGSNAGGTVSPIIGGTYIAYLFANDDSSDGIIKCGSFLTDSSGIVNVTLGWEPQFLISKSRNGVSNWWIHDILRGMTSSSSFYLSANTYNLEASSLHPYTNSTGFNVQGYNASQNYIYCAIRKGPM